MNIFSELEKKEASLLKKYERSLALEKSIIELNVRELDIFYNSFDTSEAEKRTLSSEIEEYCLEKVEQIQLNSKVSVIIHIRKQNQDKTSVMEKAFTEHFRHRSEIQLKENNRTSRKWRVNAIIGLIFLAMCLVLANIFSMPSFDGRTFYKVLSESLGIIGWVAIWEPAEYFLFDWREDVHKLNSFMKLHKAEVEVKADLD